MNYSLLGFLAAGLGLLGVLGWLSFSNTQRASRAEGLRNERENRHISYLPQVRQALAPTDYEYLNACGRVDLANRVRKDRRRVARDYLAALRSDFEKLQHFARVIAVMSPEVAVAQELQGVWLSLEFSIRFRVIYVRLLWGIGPAGAISDLSNLISALTVRMETAISSLGEGAALAAEMASSQNSMDPSG